LGGLIISDVEHFAETMDVYIELTQRLCSWSSHVGCTALAHAHGSAPAFKSVNEGHT
jgi:hypothetical protein